MCDEKIEMDVRLGLVWLHWLVRLGLEMGLSLGW